MGLMTKWFGALSDAKQTHNRAALDAAPMFAPVELISATSYAFDDEDCGFMLITTSDSSTEVTIPNEDDQQFPDFAELMVVQGASGLVTVVGADINVTLLKKDGTDGITNGFSGCIFLKRLGRNTWMMFGDYS